MTRQTSADAQNHGNTHFGRRTIGTAGEVPDSAEGISQGSHKA